MAKGNPKGGRPRVEFSMKTLTNMVRIQCTRAECAGVLGVSEDTIDRRVKEKTGEGFAVFYKTHSAGGKASLRRAQFKAATVDRQPTMLVWLGKQLLDQKDISRIEQTGADGGPIQVEESDVRSRIAGKLHGLRLIGGTDADTAKPKRRRGRGA